MSDKHDDNLEPETQFIQPCLLYTSDAADE